jgi:hypothetical protein
MSQTATDLKACRKAIPRHVQYADLPPEDRFRMLGMQGKYFIDTVKLIAYRAETAMVNIVRQTMRCHDDARSLLRSLYETESLIEVADDRQKGMTQHRKRDPRAIRHFAEVPLNPDLNFLFRVSP